MSDEHAVQPTTQGRRGPLSPMRRDGETEQRLASSYNPADPEQRKAVMRAVLTQDFRAEDIIGEVLAVEHWVTMDATRNDPDTGEEIRFVRTVLVTSDGQRISAGSDYLIAGLRTIEAIMGPAPWKPPLNLKVVSGKSRSGRTFFTLDLA